MEDGAFFQKKFHFCTRSVLMRLFCVLSVIYHKVSKLFDAVGHFY